jgi:UDP-N-acetylmuramate: L-alanyl-gamma-D-glutamyl-meso-diaminopimelate ligase
MVGFSHTSKIAVFEGDEYLTSALDLRPKFHVYQANIGIITGIAWDHINVFPTFENYLSQFQKFVNDIPADGSIIYCESDLEVKKLLDQTETACEKTPYVTPAFSVSNGHFLLPTSVTNNLAPVFLSFFGTHNLQNMMAAKEACIKAGLNQDQFFEAIQSFKGTAKRLEPIKETADSLILRDFAHAPSKLRATVNAVRELYPERQLIAVYELHTYSSLNKEFLPHYKDTLEKANIRAVLFSKHALEIKKMPMLDPTEVAAGFGEGIAVFTDKNELRKFIESHYTGKENLLLMSSGTFDGMHVDF